MLRAIRPVRKMAVAGARAAFRNEDTANEAMAVRRYQDIANESPVLNAALTAGRYAGGTGRRIAQVYATPQGKLGLGLAAAAPFVVPMVMGADKQPENPDQKPYSTGMTPSTGTGLNGGIVPLTGVELPDEASVKRKLQQLEDNQYYNQLQLQALQYVAANRGQFEQSQVTR